MIKKVSVDVVFDDITGEEDPYAEHMVYAFDGQVYQIDLSEENAKEFRKAMEPFLAVSRKATKSALLRTLPKKKRVQAPSPHLRLAPPIAGHERRADEYSEALKAVRTPQGNETEPLSPPAPTPVPEPLARLLDSDSSESEPEPLPGSVDATDDDISDEIPLMWRAFAPRPHQSDTARATSCKQWADAVGRGNVEKVSPALISDWELFYTRKLWLLDMGDGGTE